MWKGALWVIGLLVLVAAGCADISISGSTQVPSSSQVEKASAESGSLSAVGLGRQYYDAGDYQKCIDYLTSEGNDRESYSLLNKAKYRVAEQMVEEQKYLEAFEYVGTIDKWVLGENEPYNELYKICLENDFDKIYQKGIEFYDDGDHETAYWRYFRVMYLNLDSSNGSYDEMMEYYRNSRNNTEEYIEREKEREVTRKVKEEQEREARTPKEPAIGMTKDEVLSSTWGKPEKKNIDEYEWGTREQWVYSKNRYIYLENGIVTSISREE